VGASILIAERLPRQVGPFDVLPEFAHLRLELVDFRCISVNRRPCRPSWIAPRSFFELPELGVWLFRSRNIFWVERGARRIFSSKNIFRVGAVRGNRRDTPE